MTKVSAGVEEGNQRDAVTSPSPVAPTRPRPAVSRDSAFFWEGARNGELRIQRCRSCGKLRHPPGPSCPGCRSLEWDYVLSAGRGQLYSYVVHHYPPLPGFETPFVVALVELEEGVRVVGNLLEVDPAEVSIGMPVMLRFERIDDDFALPQWVRVEEAIS